MKKKIIENNDTNIENIEEDGKKKKKGKFLLILTTVLLFTFIILYFTNSTVNTISNNLFKDIPILGKTFEAIPTQDEKEERKKMLAEYYLSIDTDRAVDKLIILKKEDKKLYDDIVLEMKSNDITASNNIIDEIRDKEIKRDLLQREIDSMNKEKGTDIKEIANYYLKLGLVGTINNLEDDIIDLKLDFEQASKVVETFKPDYSAKVFYYMDENISSSIRESISTSYNNKIDKEMKKYEEYVREKQNLANIYSNKKSEESAKDLQNKEIYSAEDLSIILTNMDYLSASRILSEFEDKEYLNSVLKEIKNVEDLNKSKEGMAAFSNNVNKALKVLSLYKKDLDTLKKSYEKMTPKEIADLVNQMTTNKPKFKEYVIDETKSFTISEEELMIEILKRIKPKLLSQVITNLDDQKAAEISRKIGLPRVQE